METTLTTLQNLLLKDYDLAPLALLPSARLEDLGIDSLAAAELLFNLEDTFHIVLPPEAVTLVTLGDVVDYIDALVAAQAAVAPSGSVMAP